MQNMIIDFHIIDKGNLRMYYFILLMIAVKMHISVTQANSVPSEGKYLLL